MSRKRKLGLAALATAIITAASFVTGATLISAGVSPASQGKGGGCGFGPGICTTDLSQAHGDFVPSDGTQSFDISLDVLQTTFSFRPKGGGSPFTQHATIVTTTIFNPFEIDCFVVPDSSFVVSRDAQSASLNVTLAAPQTFQGTAVPLTQTNGASPFGGEGLCPTPGTGLPLPLGLAVTWTGPGASFSTVSNAVSRCTGIETTFQFNGVSSQATGSGIVTFPDNSTLAITLQPPFLVGFVENATITFNQTGTPAPVCSFGQ
jgi:hypothetical protein